MGWKKFITRKRTNRQRNAGILPVSLPSSNSGSNQIRDLIATPSEDTVPPVFIDLRPAASTASFSFDGVRNTAFAPFSPVHGGGSPSGSSSSGSSGKGADWSSGSSGSSMPGPNRVSYRRSIPAFIPGPARPSSCHIMDIPLNEKRERLIRDYIRAKKYWWWGFALDGVVLTGLESCMDLGKTFWRALILCALYLSFFPVWLMIVVDRRSVVERAPTALEVLAGILKMAYLFALRALFMLCGVSSSKNVLVYFLFKCIACMVIKYLSALATLKGVDQKFQLAIANLDAAPAPAPAPNLVD